MKKTLYMMALSAALSTMAFAGNYSGKLIDATCNDTREQTKVTTCDANSTTTSFAVEVNGKVYKLDSAGNTKAASALKNRADRSANPAKPMVGTINAKVTGTEKDGMIAVESIDVQ